MKDAVNAFGKSWANAQEAGDDQMMEKIMVRAISQGVDMSSVVRSAQAHLSKKQGDMFSRSFKADKVEQFQNVLNGRTE